MTTISARPRALAAASLLAALLLSGCAAPAEHDDRTQAETTTVADAWVKAVDDGMTAAFAVLSNDGHHDANIVAASTPASAMVELHEVVADGGASTMRPVEGGFVVTAGGSLALEPGGLHIMLMGVTAPLVPGDEIEIALEFADGSSSTVPFVVKEFTGAEEDYR